jgi:hypothetical protein
MTTILTDAGSRHQPDVDGFRRLVGSWRTDITYLPPDGSPPRHTRGDWDFSHALDGRAVLDVWRVPSREVALDEGLREVGLCVRIWDPRLRLWRFTFHSTATSMMIHMFGHDLGDKLVLERADGDALERWIFHTIESDSFSWRSEVSHRGGPWRTKQVVEATRRTSPARSLRDALHADRPHPHLGGAAQTFDVFTGTWACEYTHLNRAGQPTEQYPGHVIFGWVLDGRAVQDVWIGYSAQAGAEPSVGTTIRYLDPDTGQWTVTWINPEDRVVQTLCGGGTDDGRIILHGSGADGAALRWSFENIRPDAFTWRGERQEPGDREWWTSALYTMNRQGPPPRAMS